QTALVDKLTACYSAGKRLFYELEDQGHPTAADVKKLNDELGDKIEDLLKNLYGAWAGDAGRLGSQISRANRGLRDAVQQIEAQVELVENVAKALGWLDKACQLAARLLAV